MLFDIRFATFTLSRFAISVTVIVTGNTTGGHFVDVRGLYDSPLANVRLVVGVREGEGHPNQAKGRLINNLCDMRREIRAIGSRRQF